MPDSGSYDVRERHRNTEAEIARLKAQALLSWEREARTLAAFGLRDGMDVLEPGSGPGFVTEQLLRLVPNGSVTCVEVDPMLAARSKEYLTARATGRFRIVEGTVTGMDLPDNSFDFAVARVLFQHLRDPVAAGKEIRRVLKPGGKLVIIDVDDAAWGLSEPEFPEIPEILIRYGKAQAARGGDRRIGRRLWGILSKAGFEELELEAVLTHSHKTGLDPFLPMIDPDRLIPLVRGGLMTEAEVTAIRGARDRFVQTPNAALYSFTFLASGEKPKA